MRTVDPRRRCLPYACWPETDRLLFDAGFRPRDIFDEGAAAHTRLASSSIETIRHCYSRWLGFLRYADDLNDNETPIDRVTPERMRRFLELLKDVGNRPFTILGRVAGLQRALQAMYPRHDFEWLMKWNGRSLRSVLQPAPRALFIPRIGRLRRWGFEVLEQAKERPLSSRSACLFRDGLLISILAWRARRIRTIWEMRVDKEIKRTGDCYTLIFVPELIKTKRWDRVGLPRVLTPYIDEYLMKYRPVLLRDQISEWFWIAEHGERLKQLSLARVISRRGKKSFGCSFGPHRFRHAMATSLDGKTVDATGLVAGVLGISRPVVSEHYNRARTTDAARQYQSLLVALGTSETNSPGT